MNSRELKKTPRGKGLGALETDATELKRHMDRLGLTQAQLAKAANISQPQISRVLRGEQKLSAASTDRVMDVLLSLEKKREAEAPQASGTDPQKKFFTLSSYLTSEDYESPADKQARELDDYSHVIETAAFGDEQLKRDLYEFMAGPPRNRDAYEQWKSKATMILMGARFAPKWFYRIKEKDKELSDLRDMVSGLEKQITALKEMNTANKKIESLYEKWVELLQKQLRDAGLEPVDELDE